MSATNIGHCASCAKVCFFCGSTGIRSDIGRKMLVCSSCETTADKKCIACKRMGPRVAKCCGSCTRKVPQPGTCCRCGGPLVAAPARRAAEAKVEDEEEDDDAEYYVFSGELDTPGVPRPSVVILGGKERMTKIFEDWFKDEEVADRKIDSRVGTKGFPPFNRKVRGMKRGKTYLFKLIYRGDQFVQPTIDLCESIEEFKPEYKMASTFVFVVDHSEESLADVQDKWYPFLEPILAERDAMTSPYSPCVHAFCFDHAHDAIPCDDLCRQPNCNCPRPLCFTRSVKIFAIGSGPDMQETFKHSFSTNLCERAFDAFQKEERQEFKGCCTIL